MSPATEGAGARIGEGTNQARGGIMEGLEPHAGSKAGGERSQRLVPNTADLWKKQFIQKHRSLDLIFFSRFYVLNHVHLYFIGIFWVLGFFFFPSLVLYLSFLSCSPYLFYFLYFDIFLHLVHFFLWLFSEIINFFLLNRIPSHFFLLKFLKCCFFHYLLPCVLCLYYLL